MRGLIDESFRPLLPLQLRGRPLTLLIDTGFTGTIALGLDKAMELGLKMSEVELYSDTAAGGRVPFRTSSATLRWFDRQILVDVIVWQTSRLGPVDGFIGVGMLIGHILTVDLNEGVVEISDPARIRTSGP